MKGEAGRRRVRGGRAGTDLVFEAGKRRENREKNGWWDREEGRKGETEGVEGRNGKNLCLAPF